MSVVIKLGSARDSRTVTPYAPPVPAPQGQPSRKAADPRDEEIARLGALLAERDAALATLGDQVSEARAEGEAAGRLAAELEAEEDRERSLELVRGGIEQAVAALADGRDRMEALALLVARTALEKLFGDDAGRKATVADLVKLQLEALERHMLLRIEVSRIDFPDTRELAELAGKSGLGPDQISANPDLAPGACRMQMRVGSLDLGLDQQWGAVRDLLDELAAMPGDRP
ncbi:MAG: hypothetical protein QM676_01165 [Novosphingobium sp.]